MCIRADPRFEYTEPQKVHWVLPSVRLATISTLNLVCICPKEKVYQISWLIANTLFLVWSQFFVEKLFRFDASVPGGIIFSTKNLDQNNMSKLPIKQLC